jgi:radical SAM protein with 4Fe4S-binding SPASM domain
MVRLLNWLRDDFSGVRRRLQSPQAPAPGMFTYRMELSGGQRRVHLRLESDGSGVLFVDVTDVIHLNPTAAESAKWALDGVTRQEAQRRWIARCGKSQLSQIRKDLDAIYGLIQRLADPQLGCPTCSIGQVERQPLFSTAIHAPYKVDLAITYKCNNDCPHCYNEADRLTLESMPAEDWKRVIDKLVAVGIPHFIFTGGEATLYQHLPELIAYANQAGPICGLNTNGRRMAHAEYAHELAAAGLNHVQFTLGSHRPEIHDRMMNARSFSQTVQGIRNAQEAGLHTITNTTLMRMNAQEIEKTIEWLYSLGIRTFAVNGMIYSGGGYDTGQAIPEEQMPPLLIRIRDKADELGMRFLWYTPTMYCRLSPVELEIGAKRCNAGEYSMCVEPNADVLPCQSFYSSAGNLLRDPWESIWNGSLFRSFRDRELDPEGSGLPEMCWECPDLPLCGGGCRIEREASAGVRTATGSGGCSSGGCSSGGCSSGGCSSGGCGSRQQHGASGSTIDGLPIVAGGSIGVVGIKQAAGSDSGGFVPMQELRVRQSARERRGTGVFS